MPYFCCAALLGLVGFGTLMMHKTWLFFCLKALSVVGLSKCFISRVQNGCMKFAAQALLKLAGVCSSQDVWLRDVEFPPSFLPAPDLNERSPLMWISPSLQS